MTGNPQVVSGCDKEPITRLEHIQSFGFFLAMSRSWSITRVSANVERLLGVEPRSVLGMTLDHLIDKESLHEIRNRMAGLSMVGGVERLYGLKHVDGRLPFDIAVHYAGDLIVLEASRRDSIAGWMRPRWYVKWLRALIQRLSGLRQTAR